MPSHNAKNLLGQKFGRLTVISQQPTQNERTMWLCRCECGEEKILPCYVLTRGLVRSCGCLQKDVARKMKTKHNGKNTRLYNIWRDMKERCLNPNNVSYKYYGGRGITIYDDWVNNFASFRQWAENNGYNKNLTIDRVDNNGSYTPTNCRWVTMKEQSVNKSNTIKVYLCGTCYTLNELSKIYKIPIATLYYRIIIAKKSIEQALCL